MAAPMEFIHILAYIFLTIGFSSSVVIALDVWRRPQHMWIMNIVWPVAALFGTGLVLYGYYSYGRLASKAKVNSAMERGEEMPNKKETPFPIMVAKGTIHCGAGCTLGDITAEWFAFFVPASAIWLGYGTFFNEKIFAVWILDFICAFILGVLFQYFTITPMRDLSPKAGLAAAAKADTVSLIAWQIGMYGFMAFAHFYIFKTILDTSLEVNSVEFWFMMQLAMLAGFCTSYPVNWWLIRAGIKEKM